MAALWADVPDERRTRFPYAQWMGRDDEGTCPYAVSAELNVRHTPAPGEMRRCFRSVKAGASGCGAHDPDRPRPRTPLMTQARKSVRRDLQWRNPSDQLRWFRALTDDDIDSMWNVGQKIGGFIREARDTWDDERVMAFFGFDPPLRVAPPEQFWRQRHDVFSLVGG